MHVSKKGNRNQSGYTVLELFIAVSIMLVVSSVVVSVMYRMVSTQSGVGNRTEMHSGIRNATALIEQEVAQAGRITFPASSLTDVSLSSGVTVVGSASPTVTSASGIIPPTAGMFVGEWLTIDAGSSQEIVQATAVSSTAITATFANIHSSGAPVQVFGAFASGIVPCYDSGLAGDNSCTGWSSAGANGAPTISTWNSTDSQVESTAFTPATASQASSGWILKMYGDINGDGKMVFVQYTCPDRGLNGSLYRNPVLLPNPGSTASKPALSNALILMLNIQAYPPPPGPPYPTPCFTYQQKSVYNPSTGGADTYVTDVSVTLTVQTQNPDPQTGKPQQETKALLNVSPRNVFQVWELASAGAIDHVQPMPPSVVSLLP